MDLGSRNNNLGVNGCGEKQRVPCEAADKQLLSDEKHWNLTSFPCFLASDETDHLGFCLQYMVSELLKDKSFSVNTISKLQLPDLTKLGTLSPCMIQIAYSSNIVHQQLNMNASPMGNKIF